MRLLFLSNFYPPFDRGGYEQWCQEVADRLRQSGHQVTVLTSRHGAAQYDSAAQDFVLRRLHLEMEFVSWKNAVRFFVGRQKRVRENVAAIRALFARSPFDAVLVWGMWNLDWQVVAEAERLCPHGVFYYIADYWLTLPSQDLQYWRAPARTQLARASKGVLKPIAERWLARERRPALELAYALFPSAYLRAELWQKGVQFGATAVIPGAIDTSLYPVREKSGLMDRSASFQLLYVGRLSPEKGVETAIHALDHFRALNAWRPARLVIVGGGDTGYEALLRQLVIEKGLAPMVEFMGALPKERMPQVYSQADVLLFPSTWPEPFGRVIVEAMASGVVVVATATGGAAEIVADEENALVFPPQNAALLASQLVRLVRNPGLYERLAASGRRVALERFDIRRMAEGVEQYLEAALARP